MARFNPFEKVSGQFGAPMGRQNCGMIDADMRLCVAHQGGGDGYDSGGAYWGSPRNIYCVWERGNGRENRAYIRASSAADAIRIALAE